MRIAGRALAVGLTLAALVSACVAQQPCRVSMVVTAVSPDGKLIHEVIPQSLRLKVHGHDVAVLSVKPRVAGRVVVVLDGSGSMKDFDSTGRQPPIFWPIVVESAAALVKSIPENVEVALVSFGRGVSTTVAFGTDRKSMVERVLSLKEAKLTYPSKTPLWQSMEAALSMLTPAQPGDAIIAITDGGDNTSKEDLGHFERHAIDANTRIFSIVPAIAHPSTEEEMSGTRAMDELSLATGGHSQQFVRGSSTKVDLARQVMLTAVHDTALLVLGGHQVEFDMLPQPGKLVRLSLEQVNSSGKPTKTKLLYPQKLAGCKTD